MHTRTRNRL